MVFSKVGRRLRDEQRGAVLVLTSLAVVAVLGITALVIDIGHANTTGRSNQTTADASAIAAGWDIADAATARTTAAEYVADNFDISMPAASTCPTEDSITADTVCYEVASRKIWITTPWDGNDYLLRVEICEDVDTSFAGIMGFDTVNVCRYAISEAEPPQPGDGAAGPAIQAFGPADKKSFETTGAGTIWTDGDIMIASVASEAFVADGSGGVTATGEVWYDSSGGGCASLPHCGTPGFLDETSTPPVPEGNLPQGCDPDPATTGTYCGDPNFFLDVYRDSFIRNTDLNDLALCLINGLSSVGCEAFYWDGAPEHTINNSLSTDGPLRTGDTTTPTCDNGVTWMNPGYYSTTAQYSITGCVNMNPGIYMFAGGFDVQASAYLRGNNVLLINAHDKTVSRFTKSAACLTGMEEGPFEYFLYYQNPLNGNSFDVESDSVLFLAGIIYLPQGEARIQGANAGTIGSDGTQGCLGTTTLLGGSIVASSVLVKSDGFLAINKFQSGGSGSAGGSWVRLYE